MSSRQTARALLKFNSCCITYTYVRYTCISVDVAVLCLFTGCVARARVISGPDPAETWRSVGASWDRLHANHHGHGLGHFTSLVCPKHSEFQCWWRCCPVISLLPKFLGTSACSVFPVGAFNTKAASLLCLLLLFDQRRTRFGQRDLFLRRQFKI